MSDAAYGVRQSAENGNVIDGAAFEPWDGSELGPRWECVYGEVIGESCVSRDTT